MKFSGIARRPDAVGDRGEEHGVGRAEEREDHRVQQRVDHAGDRRVGDDPAHDRRLRPAGVMRDRQAAHAGGDRDADHERDERQFLLGEPGQHADEGAEAHGDGCHDLPTVEPLGHRHSAAHLECRDPGSAGRWREATGVGRDDRERQGGQHGDPPRPGGESHSPFRGRGTEPGLDDDGERELAGEGGHKHGDGEGDPVVHGEEPRGDRDGRRGDDRERDAAEKRDEAQGRATHAAAGPGMGSLTGSPPSWSHRSCRSEHPLCAPQEAHHPSPAELVGPVPQAEGQAAEQEREAPPPRVQDAAPPRGPSRGRRPAACVAVRPAERPLGSAMPPTATYGGIQPELTREVGPPIEQPEQQVGRFARLPRRGGAGAEVGVEAAELVEHRTSHQKPHLDHAPGVPAVERRCGRRAARTGAVLVDHREGPGPRPSDAAEQDRFESCPRGTRWCRWGSAGAVRRRRKRPRRRRSCHGRRRVPRSSRR